MAGLLKLRARDARDLEAVAACVQDALVALGDIKYLPRERRFGLMLNRFRWEAAPATAAERHTAGPAAASGDVGFANQGEAEYERIHSVLTFDRVRAVKHKRLEEAATDGVLSLLTLRLDGRHLLIAFAGGGALRLEIDHIHCHLEGLGESRPTVWRPQRSDDGPGGGPP